MRVLKLILITGFLCVCALLAARFLVHGNWNKRSAELSVDHSVTAIVHGYTVNPLTGWTSHLIWRRGDDKWYVYYLNHEAYFEKYELRKQDEIVEVYCNGSLTGRLDTSAGIFHHLRQKMVYNEPLDVIHGTNLDDREKWSYWQPSR